MKPQRFGKNKTRNVTLNYTLKKKSILVSAPLLFSGTNGM